MITTDLLLGVGLLAGLVALARGAEGRGDEVDAVLEHRHDLALGLLAVLDAHLVQTDMETKMVV
jgi:hypothetical protein